MDNKAQTKLKLSKISLADYELGVTLGTGSE
jgi:hypothetical protein